MDGFVLGPAAAAVELALFDARILCGKGLEDLLDDSAGDDRGRPSDWTLLGAKSKLTCFFYGHGAQAYA
jgi:hypothetical protein